MKLVMLLVFTVLCLVAVNAEEKLTDEAAGVHWALLIAGSNGWYNYRHQADICHAYHIVRKHGIPAERIVVMMYDDIAYNSQNPTPGIIINHPKGKDVYAGVVIDYKGKDVTPQNFLAVLSGNETAMKGIGSGKVIKSGPKDHIFVNYADHGGPGVIAFPDEADDLHAPDLMTTIQSMYKANQYAQMVFYVEACESGSMFSDLLPNNINVFATTAAMPTEDSVACYLDDLRDTYLGDVYSVNWMEDSDKEDLDTYTLQMQYLTVRSETNTSHVMEYGDLNISSLSVANFQGEKNSSIRSSYIDDSDDARVSQTPRGDAVPTPLVPLAILHRRLMKARARSDQRHIRDEMFKLLQSYNEVDETLRQIVLLSTEHDEQKTGRVLGDVRRQHINFDCYEPALKLYKQHCFDIHKNDYALSQLSVLADLCGEEDVTTSVILNAIQTICNHSS